MADIKFMGRAPVDQNRRPSIAIMEKASEAGRERYVRLSVTYVTGGGALNVIPPYVELGETLRIRKTEGVQRLHQRLKEVEDPMLEHDKVEETKTISDSGILKLLDDIEKWTMKKNIYSCLGILFQINYETTQEWSYLDKNENKCLLLSASVSCLRIEGQSTRCSLPESSYDDYLQTKNNIHEHRVKVKVERKSLALKSKKESSDEECSTSSSEVEEPFKEAEMTKTAKVKGSALDAEIQIILMENVQNHREKRTKEQLLEVLGVIAVKRMMK
nr:IAA-amino acid hydrolase ILR1-like 5 [Tanacetum cinerariifolium]